MITPVNNSCTLNFGSDFNSCDSYFRSDVTPVKSNLAVIFTIVIFVYKSDIIFSMDNMRSEILKNSVESTVLLKQMRAEEVGLPFGIFRPEISEAKNLRKTITLIEQSKAEEVDIPFGIFSTEITYSP